LIHHRRYGKVDPQRLDKKWNHMEGPYANDLVDDLERAVAAEDLQIEVEGMASRPAVYTRLKRGLARYRGIAAAGGGPTVPAGKLLKPGMSDSRVPVIRERLRVTGDFKGAVSNNVEYGKELESAVLAFQRRHRLATDAVVGPATLAAMNVSADARVDQIRVNLERMRWVYDELPGDLLLVDIAGQEVQLLRDEKVVWSSRVIVGRPARPTPVFRDQVEYLEINPKWTVPPTILKKDILPAMRKNPGYLKRKGLQVVTRDGKSVSPGSVDWHAPAVNFPYMIRQPPGERNALGRVKFMFPNRFSVYLHDTPNRDLFNKPRRLYSSGCVRVEHPWELAERVLDDPKRWNLQKFEEIVASKRTRWVHLERPLPVILAYWTAEAGDDGEVNFREDIYARDAAVLGALDGHGPIRIVHRETLPLPAAAVGPEDRKASAPASKPKTMSRQFPRTSALAAY
jgi:murein L,D-transpeptidase YcbB/YkuD